MDSMNIIEITGKNITGLDPGVKDVLVTFDIKQYSKYHNLTGFIYI